MNFTVGEGTSETGSPYKYTARRIDQETGNMYYRNRYYSPDLGRFMSADPIGYGDGLNMYAYVGNNPVNARDPMGLSRDDIEEISVNCPEDGIIICGFTPSTNPNGGSTGSLLGDLNPLFLRGTCRFGDSQCLSGVWSAIMIAQDKAAQQAPGDDYVEEIIVTEKRKTNDCVSGSNRPDIARLVMQNAREGLQLSKNANTEFLAAVFSAQGSLGITPWRTEGLFDGVSPTIANNDVPQGATIIGLAHIHQALGQRKGFSPADNFNNRIFLAHGTTSNGISFPNLQAVFVINAFGNVTEQTFDPDAWFQSIDQVRLGNIKGCIK